MHGRAASDGHFVFDDRMACKVAGIGERHIVAELDVVSGMTLSHDVVVVTDPGGTVVGHRSIDRDMFPEDVVVPDRNPGADAFAVVASRLRREADRGERVDRAPGTDGGVSVDPDVADGSGPRPDRDRSGDRAAWADLDVVREGDVSFDDCGWMNLWHGEILNNSGWEVPTHQQVGEKAASLGACMTSLFNL